MASSVRIARNFDDDHLVWNSFIYSKLSIFLLSSIAILTGFNIFMYLAQLNEANPICTFNDFLPPFTDVRATATPVFLYCRFLEFSIPCCILQLLLCFVALCCGLNRRNNLFLLRSLFQCYSFLCLTLLLGAIFLVGMTVIIALDVIPHAVVILLHDAYYDVSFCNHIVPVLNCTMNVGNISDMIVSKCGPRLPKVVLNRHCFDWLTEFHSIRQWKIGLLIEYGLIAVIVCALCIRACIRRKSPHELPSNNRSLTRYQGNDYGSSRVNNNDEQQTPLSYRSQSPSLRQLPPTNGDLS